MIKYLVISDIHLGHKINKTNLIIDNLRYFFKSYHKDLKKLNIIFIAGDVFDKLLITSSTEYILATEWLSELIIYCKNNNIKLRILEGTPSHDFNQARVITTIIEKLNISIDYKYIPTIYIEKMLDLNLNILYIPDEYKSDAVDTYKDVLNLLKENKLSKVDITIMHGQFHYQLPNVVLKSSHNEDDYLSITNSYISIGHIHTSSIYNRILAQGSFDRLAHGEEEDKGAMLITLDKERGNSFKFLKNTKAMVFKTYKFTNESLEDILKILDKDTKKLIGGSNIRIISEDNEFLYKNIDTIRKRYSNLNIKADKPKNIEKKYSLISDTINIDSFNITKDNIEELLSKEIEKYHLNSKELEIFNIELNIVK